MSGRLAGSADAGLVVCFVGRVGAVPAVCWVQVRGTAAGQVGPSSVEAAFLGEGGLWPPAWRLASARRVMAAACRLVRDAAFGGAARQGRRAEKAWAVGLDGDVAGA